MRVLFSPLGANKSCARVSLVTWCGRTCKCEQLVCLNLVGPQPFHCRMFWFSNPRFQCPLNVLWSDSMVQHSTCQSKQTVFLAWRGCFLFKIFYACRTLAPTNVLRLHGIVRHDTFQSEHNVCLVWPKLLSVAKCSMLAKLWLLQMSSCHIVQYDSTVCSEVSRFFA